MKVSGFSRAQITRLIRDWLQTRRLKKRKPGPRPRFAIRYAREDVLLLAAVDEAHQDLSGPAVRHLLKRGWEVYGDPAYARLAGISSIGERRRPDPRGQPGICEWTRSIKATTMGNRGCITSMRWTR
jgi:hypothetical protein